MKHGTLVVYVTGRNLDLTEKAIAEYGVRHPDVLCGDVGTTIRRYEQGRWTAGPGVGRPRAAREPALGCRGDPRRRRHRRRACASRRASTRTRSSRATTSTTSAETPCCEQVDGRVKGKFDEVIVYSFDSQDGKGLLDFLPASATKQTALEYVAEAHGCPKGEVVFCGDSGNDIFPLTAGFRGVLVRNADDQLVANVKQALERDPALTVYFAKGDFRGLSGYYTSGVIEGAYHYGLFS